MSFFGKVSCVIVFLGMFMIAGCKNDGGKLSPIDLFKKKMLEQLVFIEGGTFQMGDVGYTDEDGDFRYFTGDADVHPVHAVTLTSYGWSD